MHIRSTSILLDLRSIQVKIQILQNYTYCRSKTIVMVMYSMKSSNKCHTLSPFASCRSMLTDFHQKPQYNHIYNSKRRLRLDIPCTVHNTEMRRTKLMHKNNGHCQKKNTDKWDHQAKKSLFLGKRSLHSTIRTTLSFPIHT